MIFYNFAPLIFYQMKATLIFCIAALATVLWIISLFVRRKNSKAGVMLSWAALILMAAAVVLYNVLKEE
jgi:hypothetical protein